GDNLHSSEPIEIVTDGSDLLFLEIRAPGLRFLQRVDFSGIEFYCLPIGKYFLWREIGIRSNKN
ncbi:hypothetical protein ACW7EJ_13185, partial [Acinetobacter soli]